MHTKTKSEINISSIDQVATEYQIWKPKKILDFATLSGFYLNKCMCRLKNSFSIGLYYNCSFKRKGGKIRKIKWIVDMWCPNRRWNKRFYRKNASKWHKTNSTSFYHVLYFHAWNFVSSVGNFYFNTYLVNCHLLL